MRGFSTANVMGGNNYTIFLDEDKRVTAVCIESFGLRRMYKRNPEKDEIGLSSVTFQKAAYWICKLTPKKFNRLKETMRGDDKYYIMMENVLEKVYNEYRELIEN